MSHPRRICHWQIVTFLELLEHNAAAFCRLSSIIGQMVVVLDTVHIPDTASVGGNLGELQHEVERLGLPSATKQLKRIYEVFTQSGTKASTMRSMIMELYNRLRDDLEDRVFVAIPQEQTIHYKQPEPLFGNEVSDSFPLAAEDISEAGKCLALDRSTAVVFHLMRAMESAVQALSSTLKIENTEREWGKLLSDMGAKIQAMQKGAERNKWSETHTHLYHVKQAWRNDTMHPKQTYTFAEAKAIFDAVRVFMQHLSSLVRA